ncbi:efflux RND transporter periplasmic adaptor subunit [Olivibacter sitiensis]|uniref:efflux RND transporter periplasmic adaptor subunit n=1 Tax=Olivibacter sitiensis TaxID=376470 RepID=UPI000414B7B3|nr:efflux RND transporter periplasmic adaptor subunit [Olivibacter sitiensis]
MMMKTKTIHSNRKWLKELFLGMLFALSVLGIQSCNREGKNSEEKEAKEAGQPTDSAGVETFVLSEQQIQSQVRLPGELIAFNQVDLYAKVNSFVKKLYVDAGSRVQAGALLATLEAPEISSQFDAQTANLKAAEAAWISSKATYERLLETSKTPGTVSPNDLDVALAKRDADYARFESAKASQNEVSNMRQYLEIRAPFSGVISARNVSAGAYVGPSGKGSELPVFSLKDDQKLRLTVGVPQNYAPYLKQGQQVKFTVPTLPGEEFEAKVSRNAGALDEGIRSQRTEMDVDNRDGRLVPGMIAEVQLSLESSQKALVVPKTAVLNSTQGIYVIKVSNGKTVWVPVKDGNTSEEMAEVFGNLQYKDTIIKNASEEIRDGALLQVGLQ